MKNCCIATVVTSGYVEGALTMLHSFLTNNKWFHGDVVLIHDGIDNSDQELFKDFFDNLILTSISKELESRLKTLLESNAVNIETYKRFYSLEAFRLLGYEKVLFCDSDMIFLSSIETLFKRNEKLICCGDGPHYHGHSRDPITYERIIEKKDNSASPIKETFNAGFLLIDKIILNKDNYSKLIDFLNIDFWKKIKEKSHQDQLIYNIFFKQEKKLVDCKYNYLLLHHEVIRKKTEVLLTDAIVIHYNLPQKPWKIDGMLKHIAHDSKLTWAFKLWLSIYMDIIVLISLRKTGKF